MIKKILDERQSQMLGKSANFSFLLMYFVCVIVIIVQFVFGDGRIQTVLGETIVLIMGGISYLITNVRKGTYQGADNRYKNIVISFVISIIFTVFYAIALSQKVGNEIKIGTQVGFFFIGIAITCYLVLFVMDKIAKSQETKLEEPYLEEEELDQQETIVKIYTAPDTIRAELLLDMLKEHGIAAYKEMSSVSACLSTYGANSSFGEDIYVSKQNAVTAAELIQSLSL